MRKLRVAGIAIAALIAVGVALFAVWQLRTPLTWLMPIDHEGEVMRIAKFHKGGWHSGGEKTRQLQQFAIIFEDGFDCEGTDTSFAAIKEGDRIKVRGYHDVRGWPFIDPEWWECDEAQLVRLLPDLPEAPTDP